MDAKLEALIAHVRTLPPPTALERAIQRRGIVKAEFMGEHPEIPEEEVERMLDRALGALP